MAGLHLSTQSHRLLICLPLITGLFWFAMLLAMLLTWLISGRPKYVSQEGNVAYISDVAASFLKPLFIVGCCITGVGFMLSLVLERLLRHRGRLPPSMRKKERVFETLAIAGSIIGMLGLCFLSGFDTKRYHTAHYVCLFFFALGVILSVIFTVLEYRWLVQTHPDIKKLRYAYLVKAVIGSVLIVLAIAFGIALFYASEVGAVLEWIIGFGFTFYLLTFAYDLRAARITLEEGEDMTEKGQASLIADHREPV
ncbi:Frag1/DRAM/Sfk1 [Suillus discolor]|uniref:Frag1/DRAM/Sfk1 n=1 Tax=Suillus discolor TaxID=1912936 RepID=A0A9P7FJU3_9AGAM|nr:Frag1/DRAM/Sfk1 [Suillus discolor]KAG2118680.1 Frag1/DRAM/Sfk1 [Suillus discolor]